MARYIRLARSATKRPRSAYNMKQEQEAEYSPSTVSGEEGVQVVQIGKQYTYERGGSGFHELQREVIRRTGSGIETFQGKYSGSSFIVGGR
jgi:hypothetical protein